MLPLFQTFQRNHEIALCPEEFDSAIHKATYRYNYPEMFKAFSKMKDNEIRGILRDVIKRDRFFVAYFVAGWEDGGSSGNHPFVVNQCRMLDDGPQKGNVDVWAREHGKSACITVAGTVQRVLRDPERCTAIFSYKKGAADKFLDSIRKLLAFDFLVWCFPEILYEKPETQAHVWSLQNGIRVKRKNQARKENTVEAFGLVDGMPTGGHWDDLIWDDIETDDMADSPDQMELCFKKLQMSYNLGREGGTDQIIGTYYSHCGVLVKLGEMKKIDGSPMYNIRIFPGTDDGTINGKPVFFSQEYLDSKKTRPGFSTQILCNPTPSSEIKLDYSRFIPIPRYKLPKGRIKFVIVDPAGDKDVQKGIGNDKWSLSCLSVDPCYDDLGLSNVYIEDLIYGEMSIPEAQGAAVAVYTRNGRITMLGVERVGTDSAWSHIKNALAANKRYLEIHKKGVFGGNMMLLEPAGRTKNRRIEGNLAYPLNNGKLHIVDDLPKELLDEVKAECEKFPFFHVDILGNMAYIYDILADPTISFYFAHDEDEDEDEDFYDDSGSGRSKSAGY